MKTKRTFLSILTLCIALLFTACSGKETAGTESSNTKTESGSESAADSNSKLNDLYQQENQIFADHEDVWNKAFGMRSKVSAVCRSLRSRRKWAFTLARNSAIRNGFVR